MYDIEELLNALLPFGKNEDNKSLIDLSNTWETWNRIIKGDKFSSFGFSSEEEFNQWKLNNPYENLI